MLEDAHTVKGSFCHDDRIAIELTLALADRVLEDERGDKNRGRRSHEHRLRVCDVALADGVGTMRHDVASPGSRMVPPATM